MSCKKAPDHYAGWLATVSERPVLQRLLSPLMLKHDTKYAVGECNGHPVLVKCSAQKRLTEDGSDERQRQKEDRDECQYLDVVALLDGSFCRILHAR